MNILTYFDRGLIATTLDSIEYDTAIAGLPHTPSDDSNITHTPTPILSYLSDEARGALGSVFMGGYMIFAPFFAWGANYVKPTWLVALGQTFWVCATLLVAFSPNYILLLFGRTMVGIGEASFVGLAPTTIDNVAPPHKKTLWLAIFFSGIPVGQALGIGLGAVIEENAAISWPIYMPGWRVAFLMESLLMIPFVILCLVIPTEYNYVKPGIEKGGIDTQSFIDETMRNRKYRIDEAVWLLITNPIYMFCSLGYASYTFVVGGLSFWSPSYITSNIHISATLGKAMFGGIAVICGLLGTAAGGILVDRKGGGMTRSIKHTCISVAIAFPIGALAFFSSNPLIFFGLIAISVFLLFNIQAPVNSILLDAVYPNMRNYSMAFNVFVIHLLGDFPSPFAIGFVHDKLSAYMPGKRALLFSMVGSYSWLITAIVFFSACLVLIKQKNRRLATNQV